MGFFDFIFGKTVKINDSFFGEMVFVEFKKEPTKNYFECQRHFAPSEQDIEIAISGTLAGPDELQKSFYQKIEVHYDQMIPSIAPVIEAQFQNWNENFKIVDFKKEFKPVYLNLTALKKGKGQWDIAFESEHDLNHLFTTNMINFKATFVLIDG